MHDEQCQRSSVLYIGLVFVHMFGVVKNAGMGESESLPTRESKSCPLVVFAVL